MAEGISEDMEERIEEIRSIISENPEIKETLSPLEKRVVEAVTG